MSINSKFFLLLLAFFSFSLSLVIIFSNFGTQEARNNTKTQLKEYPEIFKQIDKNISPAIVFGWNMKEIRAESYQQYISNFKKEYETFPHTYETINKLNEKIETIQ